MTGRFALLIALSGTALADDRAEFFEKKIRPALVEHCYKCHSAESKNPKGGLRVDSRVFLLQGGDNGPAIDEKNASKSRILDAIRYTNSDLQMPPKGKLPAAVIADFEKWLKDGAVFPNGAGEKKAVEEFNLAKRKAEHWCWQPVKAYSPPAVKNEAWPHDAIDRFILAKLEEKNLAPALPATKLAWLRRVTFALTGLPPSVKEIEDFEKDAAPTAYETVADRLLASPAYGERWTRHWLDLARYAETRGHESDFEIPNAWQYRDYVIRAFNQDVPYHHFAFEQIAGEARDQSRIVEAVLGTGFWRLGEEIHSPVDIRLDQADRYDNRIDAFSKTFLGLTVSCARCHDHKFDAVSTKDYYAMFGLLQGSSDRQIRVDHRLHNGHIATNRRLAQVFSQALKTPKFDKQDSQYEAWSKSVNLVMDFSKFKYDVYPRGWYPDTMFLAYPGLLTLRNVDGKDLLHQEERRAIAFDPWWRKLKLVTGVKEEVGKLGVLPRAGFTIRTPSFELVHDNLYYLARGGGMAYAAVSNHTLLEGPLHGALIQTFKDHPEYRWVRHSLKDYKGLRLHVELTADSNTHFAIAAVVQAESEPSLPPAPALPLVPEVVRSEILEHIQREYKKNEEPGWQSQLAPGLEDGWPVDERVFIRGNPRTLGELVPHRGLEALFGPEKLQHVRGSGRYEFAVQIIDTKRNTLFTRVIVNRLWHHLFGRGIVASTDNFGVLGERPTHPELLDYLATEFEKGGYKIKPFLKRLVLSQTYRMSSQAKNDERDPQNLLLHHFRVKRLEGEAIRDSLLAVSGRLDAKMYGPPVAMHLTPFMDGRGKPEKSGPVDGDGRRSIYLAVRRNFLSPFLLAFDTPIPFSTVGTRQVSNVPAQALILMNDPFVLDMVNRWGKKTHEGPGSVEAKLNTMYLHGFARQPNAEEQAKCREFLGENPDAKAWGELANSLIQTNEFRYIP